MKILTGYLAPSAGTARIAGLDVAADRVAAAERLGYLPENGPLYPEMTPLALLRFFGHARGLSGVRLNARVEEVTHRCGLESVIEKSIRKLSKGYRQRVGMAQVLLHEPDVLIMDEPTSGLDPNQIREMRRTIRELAGGGRGHRAMSSAGERGGRLIADVGNSGDESRDRTVIDGATADGECGDRAISGGTPITSAARSMTAAENAFPAPGARTILLSTHILQEVEAVADRVILINRGRIVFDGLPEEMRGGHATLDEAFQALTEGGVCALAGM